MHTLHVPPLVGIHAAQREAWRAESFAILARKVQIRTNIPRLLQQGAGTVTTIEVKRLLDAGLSLMAPLVISKASSRSRTTKSFPPFPMILFFNKQSLNYITQSSCAHRLLWCVFGRTTVAVTMHVQVTGLFYVASSFREYFSRCE